GLPLIKNVKTVDPSDSSSPEVIQIETAMGTAAEAFPGAAAIAGGRERVPPATPTNELLLPASDGHDLGEAGPPLQAAAVTAPALDSRFFKRIGDFEARFADGVPSLREATSFSVAGDWTFGTGVRAVGEVALDETGTPDRVADGTVLGS